MMKNLTDKDFDNALSRENDSIQPSSGFAGSVMAAVISCDATPQQLPFPWKLALPGFAASALIVILLAAAFILACRTWRPFASTPADLQTILDVMSRRFLTPETPPTLAALAVAVACLLLTRRLMLPRR